MIISPGRKYIFVHIPKTGGTALATALEGRAMKADILIGDTPKAVKRRGRLKELTPAGRLWKHSTLADVKGVVDPAGYLVVTLVRNPWDRLVSFYHWAQAQTFANPIVQAAQAGSFSAFLANPRVQAAIAAQTYGSFVADATDPLFVRLEHLQTDLVPLWDHLGFALEVPRVNASARARDWREYYSEAEAALVGQLCGEDIARFSYRFEAG